MFRFLLIALLIILGACASPPKYDASTVESPMPDELLPAQAYVGKWEIQKCLNAKQAEYIEFKAQQEGLKLKRWQWKKDVLPLFEVDVKEGKQNVVTYQSKDMHDLNPVVNHTTWTWSDNRVVGSFQWQPDKGDQRGNWSGVAMAQFYIKKEEPHKLYWNRWGTSHSSDRGLSQWQSSCIYTKVKEPKVIEIKSTSVNIEAMEKAFQLSDENEDEETIEARNSEIDPDERSQRDLQFLKKSRRSSLLRAKEGSVTN